MNRTVIIPLGSLRAIPIMHDFVWYWECKGAEFAEVTVSDARLRLGSPFRIPGWDLL